MTYLFLFKTIFFFGSLFSTMKKKTKNTNISGQWLSETMLVFKKSYSHLPPPDPSLNLIRDCNFFKCVESQHLSTMSQNNSKSRCKYWATCSSACLHRSFVCLLCTACFARSLVCLLANFAHSLARGKVND